VTGAPQALVEAVCVAAYKAEARRFITSLPAALPIGISVKVRVVPVWPKIVKIDHCPWERLTVLFCLFMAYRNGKLVHSILLFSLMRANHSPIVISTQNNEVTMRRIKHEFVHTNPPLSFPREVDYC